MRNLFRTFIYVLSLYFVIQVFSFLERDSFSGEIKDAVDDIKDVIEEAEEKVDPIVDTIVKETEDWIEVVDDEEDAPVLDSEVAENTADGFKQFILETINNYEEEAIYIWDETDADTIDKAFYDGVQEAAAIPGNYTKVSGFGYQKIGDEITLDLSYLINKEQYDEGIEKADLVLKELLSLNLDSYHTVLWIHDYLIDNSFYSHDLSRDEVYTMYGLFGEGNAVCQGYADALHYLANMAGVETIVVTGEAGGEDHVWNMVNLAGDWYHVDVTWDDPKTDDGSHVKSYGYLNITNDEILRDHTYEVNEYPIALSRQYNYYVYNGQMAYEMDELQEAIMELFDEKGESLEMKVDFDLTLDELEDLVVDLGQGRYSHLSYNLSKGGIAEINNVIYW